MKTPLESLLSLKRWEEDEAKNLFAIAKKELDVQEKGLASLEENFRVLRDKMRNPDKAAVTIDEIQKLNAHMEHLFRLLQSQKLSVDASKKRLDEAMKILSEAAIERKTYEKVDERHKEAERGELKKKEQRGIDENAVMRHKKHYGE
jgi:flagellar export protein FliJ